MSKGMKSVHDMVDYVRQLRLHAKGRRAIHVHLSRLEKYFREEHYRRFVASSLRPLIQNFGATMFALPNHDVVLIVKDAPVESIDPLLEHVRRKFRESELIMALDPVQGQSDAFVEWFELESDYPAFRRYIEGLADDFERAEQPEAHMTSRSNVAAPEEAIKSDEPEEEARPMRRKVRMVPIEKPERDIAEKELDPELLAALTKALISADVGSMLRKQRVMAIVGTQKPQAVMMHRFVPKPVVYEKLLTAWVTRGDRWLEGYLDDLLASRLVFAAPNLMNEGSIASSLRMSCQAVMDPDFSAFDKGLGKQPRSTVILEFGITDILTNFGAFKAASRKVTELGYRIMVSDLDPSALLWLDYKSFQADFVKMCMPDEATDDWLDSATKGQLQQQVHDIGVARVILSGCDQSDDIKLGQSLGITLFQGDAVSPVKS